MLLSDSETSKDHVLLCAGSIKYASEIGIAMGVLLMYGIGCGTLCWHHLYACILFFFTILARGPTHAWKKLTNLLSRFLCQILWADSLLCIEPVQYEEREGYGSLYAHIVDGLICIYSLAKIKYSTSILSENLESLQSAQLWVPLCKDGNWAYGTCWGICLR
jgi:hypothetical protein